MLKIHVDNLGELAVVDCKGRIIRSESVFQLRDAVIAQSSARVIALDMYEVEAIGGGGLGMLAYLQRWANEHDIELKLFTPSPSVKNALKCGGSDFSIDVPDLHEMMTILANADRSYSLAA
jgi:anti-anti-sigma regulatory factor